MKRILKGAYWVHMARTGQLHDMYRVKHSFLNLDFNLRVSLFPRCTNLQGYIYNTILVKQRISKLRYIYSIE